MIECPTIDEKLIKHLRLIFKKDINPSDPTLIQKLLLKEGEENILSYLESRFKQQENTCIRLMN